MKKKNKFLFISLVFFLSLSFWGCEDDDPRVIKGKPFDPSKEVVFERFFPDSGGVGTKLIIVGENFGTDPDLVNVTVNNKRAAVIGVNETRIYAVVPTRADTGKIAVTIGDATKSYDHTFDKDFIYQFRQNVSTISGQTNMDGEGDVVDGTLAEAWYRRPEWLTMDRDGVLFLLEETGGLRIINQSEDKVTDAFRRGSRVRTLDFNKAQDTLYIAHDSGGDNDVAVFYSTRRDGFINHRALITGKNCNFCAVNPVDGTIFYNNYDRAKVIRWDGSKGVDQPQSYDQRAEMHGIFTPDGKTMYLIIRNFHSIWKLDYDFATKTFTNSVIFAGDPRLPGGSAGFANGVGTAARFDHPCQGVVDEFGFLYVADRNNHCIRQISPEGVVTTFAGTPGDSGFLDGEPLKAKFKSPEGICYDKDEQAFYVADYDNHRIRRIVVE